MTARLVSETLGLVWPACSPSQTFLMLNLFELPLKEKRNHVLWLRLRLSPRAEIKLSGFCHIVKSSGGGRSSGACPHVWLVSTLLVMTLTATSYPLTRRWTEKSREESWRKKSGSAEWNSLVQHGVQSQSRGSSSDSLNTSFQSKTIRAIK